MGFNLGLPLPFLTHQQGRGIAITAAWGLFLFLFLFKKKNSPARFSSPCMAFRKSFDKDSPGSWMINIIFLTCLALSATCHCSLPHVGSSSLAGPGFPGVCLVCFHLGCVLPPPHRLPLRGGQGSGPLQAASLPGLSISLKRIKRPILD